MDEILEMLEKDARLTAEEIARATKKSVAAVKHAIKKYEDEGVILKYKTIIDKDLVIKGPSAARALIEVSVAPQKNVGFDRVAERIYRFPEVSSCYLISGTYDLLVVVEGKDIHEVANFVAEKLSSMDGVRSTVTHFLLKVYKQDGDILKGKEREKRLAISI